MTEARLYGMRYETNMAIWNAIRVMKKTTAKAMLERKRGYKNEMPRINVGSWEGLNEYEQLGMRERENTPPSARIGRKY